MPTVRPASANSTPLEACTAATINGTATAANYAVTFVPGELNVTRRAATVTASSGSRPYGETTRFTTTVTGFLPDHEATARSDEQAGKKPE